MNQNQKTISFTEKSFREFKKMYAECTAETFEFEGNTFVKGYAKYLIQYVEGKLKSGRRPK